MLPTFSSWKQHILPFSVGNVELRVTQNACLARFGVHFSGPLLTIKLGKFWFFGPKCRRQIGLMPYIYMPVELKTGPIFAFSSVKNWSNFFVFFVFENLILPAERRGFFKKKRKKKTKKKTTFLALKTGPILLRNILGPVFNASLDQFLTLGFCFCCVLFLFFVGWNPYFYSVFSKTCKI